MHTVLTLRGEVTLERAIRGQEDRPFSVVTVPNSIVTAGKQHMLDLIAGLSGSNKLDSSSVLRIKNSSAVLQKTLTGLSGGYPLHPSTTTLQLRWQDSTTDSYSAHTLEVWFNGNTIQVNTLAPNFGTKPTGETWTYTFTLTASQSGGSTMQAAGIDRLLKLITGASTDTFSQTNTQLQVRTGSETPISSRSVLVSWMSATSAPTRTAETVSWPFLISAGTGTGDWTAIEIQNSVGSALLRQGTGGGGTKSATTDRTYTYKLSL